MRILRRIVIVGSLCLLTIASNALAQGVSLRPFIPDAVLQLSEGTSLELSDFGFYGQHNTPRFYIKGPQTCWPTDLTLSLGANHWQTLAIDQVRELVAEPQKENVTWLSTTITLDSGSIVRGRIPTDVQQTWLSGDWFALVGVRRIAGREGDFKMSFLDVRQLRKGEGKTRTYTLTDDKGMVTTLRDPQFALCRTPPFPGTTKYLTQDGYGVNLIVDGTTNILLRREDLRSITFNKRSGEYATLTITAQTQSGENLTGELESKILNGRVFGKTRSGQIYFAELAKYHKGTSAFDLVSIRFLR